VISIRISEEEKRQLENIAQKRKRRPSSIAKIFVLEWIEQKNILKKQKLKTLLDFRKRIQDTWVIERDPQEIIHDIRKFRGDES